MLNSSTLKLSMQAADIYKNFTKLPLSVYRNCYKSDLSTHPANLPAILRWQSESRLAESFKA